MIRFEVAHQQTKKQNQSATTVVEKFWLKDFQPHPDRLQQLSLRELWFQDLNTLLRDIFTEILLFEIKGASSPDDGVHSDSDAPPAKMQRMPSSTSDSLSWSMSSPVVIVNGRKKHQPILSNGGRFVKEVITTQILIQKFYSNLAAIDKRFHVGVTAELVLHQRPTFALLTVNSNGCDKETFKTMCRYVATDLHAIVDQSLGTPYKTELETLKGLQSLPEQLEAFGGVLKDNVATQEVKVNQVHMQSNPSPRRKKNRRGAGSLANSQSSSNSGSASGNPFMRAIERHF
jgi:hypothetical protein